jgi:hypothetical protein
LAIGPDPDNTSAQEVAKAISASASGAFREVVPQVLAGEQASPAAVAAAIERIRSIATVGDTTIIFYSGRETTDQAGKYRLAAARGANTDAAGVWYSDKQLRRDLASIPGRVVFAIDTTRVERRQDRRATGGFCGTAGESGDRLESSAGDFLRDLLNEENGIVVLRSARTAAAGQSTSGTSAFSRAFTEALSGKADQDRDGLIQLPEFSRYLQNRVSELTQGKQTLTIERPRGVRQFPLGKAPRKTIPAIKPTK